MCYLKEAQFVAGVGKCPGNATNIYYISDTINHQGKLSVPSGL